MSKTINSKIKLRNDTATNWTNNNPVLAAGEMGIESDTRKFKFGDGTTSWNNLNYVVSQREQVFINAQSALTVGTATIPATILYNITSDHSVASIYNLQSADYIINYNGVVFNNVQVIKTQLDTTQYKIEIIFFDEEYQYIIIGQTDSTGLIDTWDFNDAEICESVQSDWEQDDVTDLDYIKNRTHYRTTSNEEQVIFENATFSVTSTSKSFQDSTHDPLSDEEWQNLKNVFLNINIEDIYSLTINGNTYTGCFYKSSSTGSSALVFCNFGSNKLSNNIIQGQPINNCPIQIYKAVLSSIIMTGFEANVSYTLTFKKIFSYNYRTLNKRYLQGKLIKYGEAEGAEIFNNPLNVATGPCSHAEGGKTSATANFSHAQGSNTIASGVMSHAEGSNTTASASYAHAEGQLTEASGPVSHAEGSVTIASGWYSHAQGHGTTANHKSQHVAGEYNIPDPSTALIGTRGTYVEIIGNGTSQSARSNARTLDWNGNEVLAGKLTVGAGPANDMDVATKQYVDTAVPTKTSQLTNDSGFVTTDTNTTYSLSISGSRITLTPNSGTSSYVDIPSPDLSNYMLKTDMVAITNAEIDAICV